MACTATLGNMDGHMGARGLANLWSGGVYSVIKYQLLLHVVLLCENKYRLLHVRKNYTFNGLEIKNFFEQKWIGGV